jgi:hypothetical protein
MTTESGLEEFILVVRGCRVSLIERVSSDSRWHAKMFSDNFTQEWVNRGYKIVKVYFPDTGQQYWGDVRVSVLDAEIGYHEQRLTAIERIAIKCYVARYWDIPF